MLLPTQPEQTCDLGLLAILLLIFACYVQRGQLSERRRIEGPRCSMVGIVEFSDTIAGKTLGGLIRGWDRTTQSRYGCVAGNLMPLELSVTHQPCSRQSGEETSWAAPKPCGSREKAAGGTSTAVNLIRA